MFSCRRCNKDHFQVTEMKKEKWLMSRNRGICKCCASKDENMRQLINNAEKNPENYLTCDDCDRIFKIGAVGAPPKTGKQLRVDCPFCKSEEISRY